MPFISAGQGHEQALSTKSGLGGVGTEEEGERIVKREKIEKGRKITR